MVNVELLFRASRTAVLIGSIHLHWHFTTFIFSRDTFRLYLVPSAVRTRNCLAYSSLCHEDSEQVITYPRCVCMKFISDDENSFSVI
jgi:hypothetical protein